MKIKYFFITVSVMVVSFYSAVLFFSPGTLRWTGAADTDWTNPSNWMTESGSPTIPPNKYSTGDHVIIDGAASNFPEITVAAGARSLTVDANAKITIKAGGSLEVIGSDADGVTNSGQIIVESMASMVIDSAFDDGLINLAGAKVTNAGTFTITNGFGSRIKNQDSIINTGNFIVQQGVDTAVINYGTGTIKNPGIFNISGGSTSQLSNYGKFLNESGSLGVIGGLSGILVLNRNGALIQNAGNFTVGSGFGRRIDNEGTINNASTFTIYGADGGEGIVNRANGILNNTAGYLSISGGHATQLDNSGTVNNYSSFSITGGGGTGHGLVNDTSGIFNHYAGTLLSTSGNGTKVINSGFISINGTSTFGAGPGKALINNSAGRIEHFGSLLTVQAYSITGFQNEGTYHGGAASSLSIASGYGSGIVNSGTFTDTAGCNIDIHGLSGDLIQNSGLMLLDCATMLYSTPARAIFNTSTGTYRQAQGSISYYSLGSHFIENDNYFYSDVAMNLTPFIGGVGNYLIYNKDSIILGPSHSMQATGTTRFVYNGPGGYLDNAGDWEFRNGGGGYPVMQNEGTVFFRNTSSLEGAQITSEVIINTGVFFQEGTIEFREFQSSLLNNSNFFNNSGTMIGRKLGSSVNAIVNSDTLINSGILEVDTTLNNGLSNTGFFLNDSSGIFYADFLGMNGILNGGSGIVKNNGELWMARDTGIGLAGILNQGLFENCKLINIGQKGPLFGGGILNPGNFRNLPGGEIFIYHVDTFGILNSNQFLNSCAYIETEGIIQDNNTFINDGVILKVIDTNSLPSNILTNNNAVFNADPDPFNAANNNGQIGTPANPSHHIYVDASNSPFNGCATSLSSIYAAIQAIFVVNDQGQTGASWEFALSDLQVALAIAEPGDTIHVAQGTYYPDTVGGLSLNRELSFNIPDSVIVLGGYPSGGGTPEERDWVCNKTILCGDIDQDGTLSGNSFHVVTTFGVDSVTIVDGFCIQGGNADSSDQMGNGVYPYSSGGGWFNEGRGVDVSSSPTIRNCIFTGNQAFYGAGMLNDGGGFGSCLTTYFNCIFNNNHSLETGGGVYNTGEYGFCMPTFVNTIISGNAADRHGGGMFNIGTGGTCTPQLINCVLNGNIVEGAGGALYNYDAHPFMINCITWNHDEDDVFEGQGTFSTLIRFSITQSGATYSGSDNKIDGTDPLFIDAPSYSDAPTAAGNFHVMSGSMAINMGDNFSNTYPTDLDGLNRIAEAVIDIGAYEKLIYCDEDTIYVTGSGSIPSFSLDSILSDAIPEGFTLLVNGVPTVESDSLSFDCSNLGLHIYEVLLVRNCDTLDGCTQFLLVSDTFPKNLVCNDLVNVSLGTSCMKAVILDDVLEHNIGCREGLYDIQVIYPLGTHRFPGEDQVDLSHIGLTMVYNVYEVGTGNKCWGYLKVEDKQPPLLNCSVDTITCYELPDLPLLAEGADSCSGAKVKLVSEQWFDYGCDQDPVLSGYVVRTIQGSDNWGNFARCTDTIFIRKTVLDSLVCPETIELPCEITHQIGSATKPIIHTGRLKYPILVDRNKVTPEFLLELQKPIYDLIDPVDQHEYKGPVLNPFIIVVPQIEGKNIYPAAGGSCKITAIYNDVDLDVCGAGFKVYRKWIVTDWCTLEEEECEQYIKVVDTSAPRILKPLDPIFANVSPHDCVAGVVLPALSAGTDFRDCGTVSQKYTISYEDPSHPGKTVVLTGDLPSKTLYLPMGEFRVEISLADACFNRTDTSRYVVVTDVTPPIPVCNEITQVTIDPATCWAKISAKELDNGSRDNCCEVLHYAAAHMDSITYWRNYWTEKLTTEVGEKSFAKERLEYEALIEDWINCYVFSDTVNFTDCGSDSIVLRVYEACGVPRYDPHVFPCGPHAWFCYNTYEYIGDFNWNWFDKDGPKSCSYRPALTSLKKLDKKYEAYGTKGYMQPKYEGAAQYLYCQVPFYFPSLQLMLQAKSSVGGGNAPGSYCSDRLYNDCMVLVLVDDKEAPVVHELEDVTVYCDDVPYFGAYPKDCSTGKKNGIWPGYLKDRDGTIHGYYGGYGVEDEHAPDCGHYDHKKNWAPVYCREWLYLDSFDTGGIIVPETYFEVPVFFDKTRPKRALAKHEFSITDNCRLDDSSLTYMDDGDINACGEGWIQRTWTMRDACGNEVIARQKVLVKHRSDFEVVFPADTVMVCDYTQGTGPEVTGRPDVTDDECEQITVKFEDQVFSVDDGACYKIVRTWTIFDWCIYEPNRTERYPEVIVDDRLRADTGNRECVYRNLKDNNDGYMQYIQVIKVVDHEGPVIKVKDTTVCITSENCISETVRIPLSATDNCAEPEQIHFQVEIDQNATDAVYTNLTYDKASIELIILGNPRELVYAASGEGRHVVHVIATDNCGNKDTVSYRLELKDCKKPTPYCFSGIATVVMPSTGTVTVWAKDLDAGSFDNCTDKGGLIFSFSADKTQTSREFRCADIPNGRSQTLPVEIWVTDEAGNQDHCGTFLLLQDNAGNACPDTAGLNVMIAGKVETEGKEPVEKVRVKISGSGLDLGFETSEKGQYEFGNLPSKADYAIEARRNDQPMNGISTLDLILIQKHILGTLPLDSPYKIIAADVDNDKQVTAIDLVELRKLILATYEELPNTESWRIIPKAQTFEDPQNPWNFRTKIEMKQVEKDYMQEDWIGIKTGDVNASAAAHSLMGTEVRENNRGLIFEIIDRQFIAGDLVSVEFRSPNFRGISGFQGTMEVDGGRWVVDGSHTPGSGVLSLSDQNFGNRKVAEGLITMSWNSNTGVDVTDQEVLFTLTFKAGQNGRLSEALRMGSQVTIAESYEGKGEVSNLAIRFVTPEGNEVNTRSELYQNYPNPFDQRTVIGLRLAKEGRGTLSIYDVTGRIIRSIERDWTKGYHEVWLDRREIGATGVLYYRFESGFFTDSKKMVIVE